METPTLSSPIQLSSQAIEEALNIRKTENIPTDKLLRIGVKGGGCSGLSYVLEFDVRTE